MSMISAQIDELRNYADRADGTFPMLASALRDAADTIWQLRDDLQRTNAKFNAENAKLREERDMYRDLVGMMDHPDLNAQLQAENAKLQASNEVIAEDHAALCEHNAKLRELLDYMTPIAWYAASERERDHMRELGVEVDDG